MAKLVAGDLRAKGHIVSLTEGKSAGGFWDDDFWDEPKKTPPPPPPPPPPPSRESAELARLRLENSSLRRQLAEANKRSLARSSDLDDLLRKFGLPAYRALTKFAHPDAGGDHDWMVRINAAWDRIGRSA
jgi:hypothetical protein